jgi:hypothetical protein
LAHHLQRHAVLDRGERCNGGAIAHFLKRLAELHLQQAGQGRRPIPAQKRFCRRQGMKREIGRNHR